jgi:hypothetical protein
MSAPAASGAVLPTPTASQVAAWQGSGQQLDIATPYGARPLTIDTTVASLLATEARQRAITRVFGVAREDQSWLVTIVLCGSVAAVAWDAPAKVMPHPTAADLKIGGSLINTGVYGLTGLPPRTFPFAGAVLAFVLMSHGGRTTLLDALKEFRIAGRELDREFRHRYGHLIRTTRSRSRLRAAYGVRCERGNLSKPLSQWTSRSSTRTASPDARLRQRLQSSRLSPPALAPVVLCERVQRDPETLAARREEQRRPAKLRPRHRSRVEAQGTGGWIVLEGLRRSGVTANIACHPHASMRDAASDRQRDRALLRDPGRRSPTAADHGSDWGRWPL